jgi:hypothetical protein
MDVRNGGTYIYIYIDVRKRGTYIQGCEERWHTYIYVNGGTYRRGWAALE